MDSESGKVVFTHAVKPGVVEDSYGVYVAELAGLPSTVIERANLFLERLRKGQKQYRSLVSEVFYEVEGETERERELEREKERERK